MFKTQKKNKKGFALIEMLVVIAIIAILVAIIIPVVSHSTVKAAAATNAANLRAVEGQLKIMRLNYPEHFETILSRLNDGTMGQLKEGLGEVFDFLFGSGWTDAQLQEYFARFDAENGVLTLYQPDIVVNNVPQSKKVKIKGTKKFDTVNVEEGTDMTVYVTEDDIRCVYIGADGSAYGIEHFADIAEDGQLNSTSVNHNGVEGDGGWCYTFGHSMNAQGICTVCGFDAGYHTCVDEKTHGIKIGDWIIGEKNEPDGLCDVCGADMNHTCVDQNPSDHACDRGCGTVLSMCDDFTPVPVDQATHKCPVCGGNVAAHRYAGGFCVECGRAEHLSPDDCTDASGDGDHTCDYPGCGYEGVTDCTDGSDANHNCDECDIPDISPCVDSDTDHYCDQSCGETFNTPCTIGGSLTHYQDGRTHKHTSCTYCKGDAANCEDVGSNNGTGDHLCNGCGYQLSNCNSSNYRKCDVCGKGGSSGGGGSTPCVTPDTLVTLADGSQKRMDALAYGDELLVWNFYTGTYTTAPVSLIINHGYSVQTIVELIFDDGTSINFVNVHDAFDLDLNIFAEISAETVDSFLGHRFAKMTADGYTEVKLVDYNITNEYNGSYSLLSAKHYNAILNGMLTLSPSLDAGRLYEPFEVFDGMKYDADKVAQDIATYGQYTYEEFAGVLTEEQFEVWGLANAKVSVGKGNTSYEAIIYMLQVFAFPYV